MKKQKKTYIDATPLLLLLPLSAKVMEVMFSMCQHVIVVVGGCKRLLVG